MILKMLKAVWLGAGLAALLLGGGAEPAAKASEDLQDEISVSQAKGKMDAGAFVLDVREPDEWQQAHIPGATHIPLSQLEKRAGELPPDKEIVVV